MDIKKVDSHGVRSESFSMPIHIVQTLAQVRNHFSSAQLSKGFEQRSNVRAAYQLILYLHDIVQDYKFEKYVAEFEELNKSTYNLIKKMERERSFDATTRALDRLHLLFRILVRELRRVNLLPAENFEVMMDGKESEGNDESTIL